MDGSKRGVIGGIEEFTRLTPSRSCRVLAEADQYSAGQTVQTPPLPRSARKSDIPPAHPHHHDTALTALLDLDGPRRLYFRSVGRVRGQLHCEPRRGSVGLCGIAVLVEGCHF